MIIYGGKIYDGSEQDRLLAELGPRITKVLAEKTLEKDKVIAAIDALGREIDEGRYDDVFRLLDADNAESYKSLATAMLSEENLLFKLKTELGDMPSEYETNPPKSLPKIKVKRMPLGVIFHIAAGNADGLPAFSLAEGLLCGNINILKLPHADNGISLKIIFRLIELEPALADFVYVFDTPSTDIAAMRKMANLADGICVWGGDVAIEAVRNLAPVNTKLIEWGHKLSFCYISGYENKKEELAALAEHIADTRQLLCSSCQTIFIDGKDKKDLVDFCNDFLPILEKAVARHGKGSLGERAYFSLLAQTERLEKIFGKSESNETVGKRCRLIIADDGDIELSPMSCAPLVKLLPQEKIPETLRRQKGYLQTAGLICEREKREKLTELFAACGVTKISRAGNMSKYFTGEAHDGEYPLMRYTRIVNIEP